jgi:hypothetical protein
MHVRLQWEHLKKIDHLEIPGVNGRLIVKIYVKLVRWENVDWIYLAEGKNEWQHCV